MFVPTALMARITPRVSLQPLLRTCLAEPGKLVFRQCSLRCWQSNASRSLTSTPSSTIRSEPGLQGLDACIAQYREAPSPELLDDAMSILSRESHRMKLDQRVTGMLQDRAASRLAEETLPVFQHVTGLVSVTSFTHQYLGDEKSDMSMEFLEKEITLNQDGKDALTLRFTWNSSTSRLQGADAQALVYGTGAGSQQGEYSAEVFANGVRILYATELSQSASAQAWEAIRLHLGAEAAPPADFAWLLAVLAAFPSDPAFDALSAALLALHAPSDPHPDAGS